jgi:Transposase IS66 family
MGNIAGLFQWVGHAANSHISSGDSTRTGYFWAYVGDDDHPYTVYHYRDSRGHEGPAEVLKNYRGYLQTDA